MIKNTRLYLSRLLVPKKPGRMPPKPKVLRKQWTHPRVIRKMIELKFGKFGTSNEIYLRNAEIARRVKIDRKRVDYWVQKYLANGNTIPEKR
jgi:predicted regulator of amino acid metabolism with ACT domain